MSSATAKLLIPLALGCALSVSVLTFSERSHQRLNDANRLMTRSMETQAVVSQLLALLSDAETGQRGFVLTGKTRYLEPYLAAVPQIDPKLRRLQELTADSPEQRQHAERLGKLAGEKLSELQAVLALYRKKGPQAARTLIETDLGRRTMDEIRKEVDAVREEERAELIQRASRWNEDVATARFGMTLITVFTLALVIAIFFFARREIVQRERTSRALEEQVRERTAELSELSTNLQTVQEEEKARLAHDIHDELGGILVSAKMDLSWVYARLRQQDPGLAQRLARAIAALDEGVDIKRRIIEDLRPTVLDTLGLGAAIGWYVDQTCRRGTLKCVVSIKPTDIELPSPVCIALFRVMQEALTNIVRHAGGTTAWITLEQTVKGLLFVIRDDGLGFSVGSERKTLSHGIAGMRQRITSLGGVFRIESEPGMGTTIRIFLPLAACTAAAATNGLPVPHSGR